MDFRYESDTKSSRKDAGILQTVTFRLEKHVEFLIKVDVTGYLGVWFLQEEAFLKLIRTLKWNK